MKILILGCGQIGSTIASNLAKMSQNDVTIIDTNEKALQKISQRLDVQTILGNGAWPSVMSAAGATDTDMLLALTQNDETNMAACRIAYSLFNIPNRIARVRYSDFVEFETDNETNKTTLDFFNITETISPEQLVTDQIVNLLIYPGALQIVSFAQNKVRLVVLRTRRGGLLVNQSISKLKEHLKVDVDCQICAIYRHDRLIIPTGSTILEEDDEVFVLIPTAHIEEVMRELRPVIQRTRRIMIAGGGNVGFRVAKKLENILDIKIIERKAERAEWLAENLNNTLVLNGNASDESLLENEYIDEIDIFCALTDDDENNIMSSILAKNLGAKRVMSIINRRSYVDLLQGNTINIVISPHLITIGSILTHVHMGDVVAFHPLRRDNAEAIEVVLHGDKHTSKLVGRKMSRVRLPNDCYFSAIVRNDEIFMAHNDIELKEGDHVIFFVSNRQAMPHLEKLIQVKLGFFA